MPLIVTGKNFKVALILRRSKVLSPIVMWLKTVFPRRNSGCFEERQWHAVVDIGVNSNSLDNSFRYSG
tara:strand:- start:87 stop:290 length:204 start_codon:yes stop_codon:yes gene_type:complete